MRDLRDSSYLNYLLLITYPTGSPPALLARSVSIYISIYLEIKMTTFRIFVSDMPHQEIRADAYRSDSIDGYLRFYVKDEVVATFKTWSFVYKVV